MFRSIKTLCLAIVCGVIAIVFVPGCSDDECPTCPELPAGVSLSSDVMLPSPAPYGFEDLWVAGAGDLFVAAGGGMVLRMQGGEWTGYRTGAAGRLLGIWGTAPDNVYAVGERGVVVRFDGASWRAQSSSTLSNLYGIHGTSASDLYAVGDFGAIVHSDGGAWTPVDPGLPAGNRTYYDVWCAATGGEVFASGAQWSPSYVGAVAHYDGAWSEASIGTQYLPSIWGAAPDDVYTHNQLGQIFRYDGSAWSLIHTYSGTVTSLDGDPVTGTVYMVGSEYYPMIGRDVGLTYRYESGSWWTTYQGRYVPKHTANAVYSAGEKYCASEGSVVWSDPDDLELSLAGDAWLTDDNLNGMWGNAAGDVYAVGEYGTVLHYDGTAWEVMETPVDDVVLSAIWGPEPGRLYAVGRNGTVLYYNGLSWKQISHGLGGDDLHAVWSAAADNIRVGAGPGKIWVSDGVSWTSDDAWSADYGSALSLWGTSDNDIYAVTNHGVMHFDGAVWAPLALGGRRIRGVHGVSATEVYFVAAMAGSPVAAGHGGGPDRIGITQGFSLLRYDGADYTVVLEDASAAFAEVWALGSNNVFLAGPQGDQAAVGHFDGSGLVVEPLGVESWIGGLWGTGNGTVYVCGSDGMIARTTRN